jgi:hypothetical protein
LKDEAFPKKTVTPVNPPEADKNRGPEISKVLRKPGFRLEFIRLRRAGMTKRKNIGLLRDASRLDYGLV